MSKLAVVDIESLDTTTSAVILSIGCVIVDSKNLEVVDEFYSVINREQKDRTQSLDTINWWFQQANDSPAAFDEVLQTYNGAKDLSEVLKDFAGWLETIFENEKIQMFGNGPEFDNAILDHAYKQNGLKTPWRYSGNQSMRTINLLKETFRDDLTPIEFTGIKHHALDDAHHEAKQLIQAIALFKEMKRLAEQMQEVQSDIKFPKAEVIENNEPQTV